MANTLLTPQVIAKEAMLWLENSMVAGQLVYRDYESEFGATKVGSTVSIRRPNRYTVRYGNVASLQNTQEGSMNVAVDTQVGVDMSFQSSDMTLTIDKFAERYIKPAMSRLANEIDLVVLQTAAQNTWNWVGTPGTVVGGFASIARVGQRMDEMAVPVDERVAILNPADQWGIMTNLTGLYIQDTAKSVLTNAKLPKIGNITPYMDQNVYTFTTGVRGGTPVVNGAGQATTYTGNASTGNTSTLAINGATASVTGWAAAGDVFTIAGCYAVNPVTKKQLPYLQQFVVKSAANTDGTGATTLTVSPAIIASGAYQTVSAAPANSAALTFLGSANTAYSQSLAFRKEAFALVTVPMELPRSAVVAERVTYKGLSIRMTGGYDITNDVDIFRFDVLFGTKAVYADLACRISG